MKSSPVCASEEQHYLLLCRKTQFLGLYFCTWSQLWSPGFTMPVGRAPAGQAIANLCPAKTSPTPQGFILPPLHQWEAIILIGNGTMKIDYQDFTRSCEGGKSGQFRPPSLPCSSGSTLFVCPLVWFLSASVAWVRPFLIYEGKLPKTKYNPRILEFTEEVLL